MSEWIIILYVFFVLLSAVLNALKEVQKKRPITIPKTEIPPMEEIETYPKKEKTLKKKVEITEPKAQDTFYPKFEEKRKESAKKDLPSKENYIEKSLKNNLQEIIALIEIVGPPKAYQKWSIPYKKKD